MNRLANLKRWRRLWLIGCLLGSASLVQAVNYTNTDLLLIFRKDGFNDVEFDLGSITQYVGLAPGTQRSVNFDAALVKSNFNDSLADVGFLLVAGTGLDSTQPRVWMSDYFLDSTPSDFTLSKFSQIRSKISEIGLQASVLTSSNAMPAVVATSQPGSYTYIASDGNFTPASSLGGLTAFPLQASAPGTLSLYEFQVSTATPKPNATLLGRLAFDAAGSLNFTAGSAPALTAPQVASVVRAQGSTALTVNSVAGVKYQLTAAAMVTGPFAPVGDAVAGTGGVLTLSETTAEPVRFYRIQVSN